MTESMKETDPRHCEPEKRLLVLGIGNYVLQDEGFGIHAVKALAAEGNLPQGVDILDGGTAGLHLMGNLRDYDRIIVIDACLDSNPVGTVRCLKPSYGEFPPLVTAHEIGLKDTLEAMQLTGYCPDVDLVVCSVERFTSLGTQLSPGVEAALPLALEAVRSLIVSKLSAQPSAR